MAYALMRVNSLGAYAFFVPASLHSQSKMLTLHNDRVRKYHYALYVGGNF